MSSSPNPSFVTFELKTEKAKTSKVNYLKWSLPVNEELLSNGNWFLSVMDVSIEFQDINNPGGNEETKKRMMKQLKEVKCFKISSNLVKSEFVWYSKVHRFSDSYSEFHPIEYVNVTCQSLNSEAAVARKAGSWLHRINNVTDTLKIKLEPLYETGYGLKDLQCKACLLVSIGKL